MSVRSVLKMGPPQPPTLGDPSDQMVFLDSLRNELEGDIRENRAGVYFRAQGFSDNTILPSQWREVQWTVDDFVTFFDCPETREALDWYSAEYQSRFPLAAFPTWDEVVDRMQAAFNDHPDTLPYYMFLRQESDKAQWEPVDYAVTSILRLLNYRMHIENGSPDTRDDFQTRQAAWAQSFGSRNPFYMQWDASDKWTAAYLIYLGLAYWHDQYAIRYIEANPESFVDDYERAYNTTGVNPVAHQQYQDQMEAIQKRVADNMVRTSAPQNQGWSLFYFR